MSDLDKILARLANLKDLAQRTDSAGEAAAAVAGIQRLLFSYNLTMADVPEKGEEFVSEGFHVEGDPGASPQRWKSWLLGAVARANFCRGITRHRTWHDNAHVVGRPANVRVVIETYKYLEANAKRQCLQAWKRYEHDDYAGRAIFNRGFFAEYVRVLNFRLQSQVKESTQEAGANGSALVVQLNWEVDAALERFYPDLKYLGKGTRPASVSAEGIAAGYAAGKSVNFDKQVYSSELLALTR